MTSAVIVAPPSGSKAKVAIAKSDDEHDKHDVSLPTHVCLELFDLQICKQRT
jgi:hypothetical protein